MDKVSSRSPLVLVLAGAGYGQQAPLLWWTDTLVRQAGCAVVAPRWTVDHTAEADPVRFVEQALTTALAGRRPDLVVAKSFGCAALPWALAEGVPGVWLTPVLTDAAVREALAAAGEVHTALGGSADPVWRPELVRGTRARLQTVDRADHRLEVPGDWRASQRLQADVLAVVEERVAAL
ncbi:hypothetical protein E9228_001222 [Curtobacterium flaccumfaciens]|uniref:Alpha/beta hydrolase n=1 Tax=Curtobacterium salicis TaxID=1779862 RepID=A0ABX0T548_9MICO|nr:hypothetical protein [Curtobacterium sp. WW7]NII40586.1 hypothetical protein [Curtobacterium sp. WW7]